MDCCFTLLWERATKILGRSHTASRLRIDAAVWQSGVLPCAEEVQRPDNTIDDRFRTAPSVLLPELCQQAHAR